MRIKKNSKIIIAGVICISSILILMLCIIPWDSGIETIKFKHFDQHLSWSYYYEGSNNQYFTLDRYSFSLNDVLLENANWPWKWHIGLAIFIMIIASDINGTYVDQLEKTTLWEGIAYWNGHWDYESPDISLDALHSIHSTGFKAQVSLIFKYALIKSIFIFSIHEATLVVGEIEYP